jgi:hypothetical protein
MLKQGKLARLIKQGEIFGQLIISKTEIVPICLNTTKTMKNVCLGLKKSQFYQKNYL